MSHPAPTANGAADGARDGRGEVVRTDAAPPIDNDAGDRAGSDDRTMRAAARRGRDAPAVRRGADAAVLPSRGDGDSDAGWGDEPSARDAGWYDRERPPHHE